MGDPLLNADPSTGPSTGPGTGPDAERTRAAVLRYVEALNAHDADAIAARVSEDFVNEHTSAMGRNVTGRAGYRANLTVFLADFADLRYDVEDLVAEDDRAALAYLMSFRPAVPGAGTVRVRGVFRFRVGPDGLIAHRVDYWDSGEVRRQLDPPA
ncbi:ester cyclase [Streptosporangium sp. DT93]|uniref:ester cyclase n=1 Tax=Streptosporangium sp. DT93 TaxID=3393428 RepID=UPI003CEC5839